ncbi:hypothetical protein QFZ56_000363 [Streptomyces achromogenes]|uniref:Uncharacterized protein n=1 Tax=Streptomyces achromogenes TaxID=67255 RepID=A0ABU0PSN7_STRAH|nr:hypothetical protein [Streptomyces achromogenes]MDQ0681400.1 hypothetical protein [Streptomyces achromogenes]
MSGGDDEPAPGCTVRTTPQELATELAVLTEVDWREVWPGAGRGHEPDPAWLARFDWQVVDFQWRSNDWGPITVQTRTGKRHHLSTTTSHSMEYAYASHRLWVGSTADDHEGVHEREAVEAAAAWEEYLASAQGVLGAPTWSGAWDSADFPVSFGDRAGALEQRREYNPYRLAVWNPRGPEGAVIVLRIYADIYGGHSVDLKLHDPALIVLDESDAEVETKVRAVSSWGEAPGAPRIFGDPEPTDKPDMTWQDVASQLKAVSAWDWDAIFGAHPWNRAFASMGELEQWARRLRWTVADVDDSGRVCVVTEDGHSVWLPPLLRYPARVNWLESKLWRITSRPSSSFHRNVLEPADALWADCTAAAREILGEPGHCGDPDSPHFPREWQSWREESRGFKIHTRWSALWPSAGDPAPAIGLFMQGGFLERGFEKEAAQLDLRIWRPAASRSL